MMQRAAIFFILGLGLVGAGCFTRTQVGDGLGVTSPDGKMVCAVTGHGAFHHAYIDKTRKVLTISIGNESPDGNPNGFRKSYTIRGSDVEWHTRWISNENVAVDVFDHGDGVSSYDIRPAGTGSNFIKTLSFQLDRQKGRFAEKQPGAD